MSYSNNFEVTRLHSRRVVAFDRVPVIEPLRSDDLPPIGMLSSYTLAMTGFLGNPLRLNHSIEEVVRLVFRDRVPKAE